MLSSISWSSYTTMIVVGLLFYYTSIGFKYYRHDLLWLVSHRSSKQGSGAVQSSSQPAVALVGLPYLVQSFSDEVAGYLQQVAQEEITSTTVLLGLRTIASKYPTLIGSSYQSSLEQLVIHEASTYCQLPLDADAVKGIWKQG